MNWWISIMRWNIWAKSQHCRKSWSPTERRRWIKKHKKLLRTGEIQKVTDAIKILCKDRGSKEFRRERNYFLRNQHRMNYDVIEKMRLPIGSGAMESAVRRVVNLRLKGPAIYWHLATAEAMLTLRSYFKSGRWDMLKNQAATPILEAGIQCLLFAHAARKYKKGEGTAYQDTK